ncbi:MAG: hypothetical protein D6820_04495, partial [Lentisphaerae bacterium]
MLLLILNNLFPDQHPRIIITNPEKKNLIDKIERTPWAKAYFDELKRDLDEDMKLWQRQPDFFTSRLAMNWETHYTTPLVAKSRTVGGEGRAPVPTPRFEDARDWATNYHKPAGGIRHWRPYNDKGGKIWLINGKTGKEELVDPGLTGHNTSSINRALMELAERAAFLYWVTGNEQYAAFATDIFWTYTYGLYFTKPPKIIGDPGNMPHIIGVTSFEVIHEGIVRHLALCYDFLYSYLKKTGKDTRIPQVCLKRFAERIFRGGGAKGNWNLHQAGHIAYAALALEPDKSYPDGKGREYYLNIVLNANTKTQEGILRVIKHGFDQKTGLWPESPGYAFGSLKTLIEIGTLLARDETGKQLLTDPFLMKIMDAQTHILYPNGLSIGLGDLYYAKLPYQAYEDMVSALSFYGKREETGHLASILKHGIVTGLYQRRPRNLRSLVQMVEDLNHVPAALPPRYRHYYASPLNALIMRSHGQTFTMAATLAGYRGGHCHPNGISLELFATGMVLAPDPGRGSSYWQADHHEYYLQNIAHNTVVPCGNRAPKKAIKIVRMEPKPMEQALSDSLSWATVSFNYSSPATEQQRTVAMIKPEKQHGFFIDLFRSRIQSNAPQPFHDYVYHNMGSCRPEIPSNWHSASSFTNAKRLQRGYRYFKKVQQAKVDDLFAANFSLELPDATHCMKVFMPGQKNRTAFVMLAPPNRTAAHSPPPLTREKAKEPTSAFIIREDGADAWTHPFIAIMEPYLAHYGSRIRRIELLPVSHPLVVGIQITT